MCCRERKIKVPLGERMARNHVESEFEVAQDDRENIIEVVGDSTSKLADTFHFLGLEQLLSKFMLLAHVLNDHRDAATVLVDFRHAKFGGDNPPSNPTSERHVMLDKGGLARFEQPGVFFVGELHDLRGQKIFESTTQNAFGILPHQVQEP